MIIYGLPRTGSTAALHASKRRTKIFEPFNPSELFGRALGAHIKNNEPDFFRLANNYTPEILKSHFDYVNSENACVKLISNSFKNFYPGRIWFQQVQEQESHDIFVIIRDLREQFLSHCLASKFGYFYHQEVEPYEFEIPENHVCSAIENIDTFIRFLPKKAKIINLGNLPDEYFQLESIKLKPQNSLNKIKYIKNLDRIEELLDYGIKWIKPFYEDSLAKVQTW